MAGAAIAALLCVSAALGRPEGPVARLDPAGVVHYAKPATSSFDRYSRRPSARRQAWMRAHYWRMRAYSPYFDSRTRWYGNAWFYRDAYALYRGRRSAREHPEWILRDGRGRRLYIPFDCARDSCPQYAADIGNPAFRAHWIAGARASLARGYTGVFVDDVNMELRVSDGTGRAVAPRDPRTGKAMTLDAWRRYMADFMVQIRRALPGAEIVHNALWFAGDDDPHVRRQLLAADLIEIERGFEDAGLAGGDGRYGFGTLLGFIDRRHADGQGVILDGGSRSPRWRLYGLAGYFLVSSGRDALAGGSGGSPGDWWSEGYDADLGAALGERYRDAGGVWRRDFAGGVALLNEPGAPARQVALPAGLRDLDGRPRSAVTLGPASGAVLLR
jgi:hypothetical protein